MKAYVCYCFKYTEADIAKDLKLNGRSTLLEKIIVEKKAGVCQCATTNPQGR